MTNNEFKGETGTIVITATSVIIKRGVMQAVAGDKLARGTKEIPFSAITAVQFKKAGPLGTGFLQLTIKGGRESLGSVKEARRDENSVVFDWENNQKFEVARNLILAEIHRPRPREAYEDRHAKICPDCAEHVRVAARVCRFCGHTFD